MYVDLYTFEPFEILTDIRAIGLYGCIKIHTIYTVGNIRHNGSLYDNMFKLHKIIAVPQLFAETFTLAYKLPNMALETRKTISAINLSQ